MDMWCGHVHACVCVRMHIGGCSLGPANITDASSWVPLEDPSGRILGHEDTRSNTNAITRTKAYACAHPRWRTPVVGADISLLRGPVLSPS